jgi:hypothetical protein
MYKNGKIRRVETVPGMGEGGAKGERWGEFSCDIL